MNGLTLRINPTNKKGNNFMKFAYITLPGHEDIGNTISNLKEYFLSEECLGHGHKHQLFDEFLKSNSADEQLAKIRSIIENIGSNSDPEKLRFLSLVFLQADAKHPVKCFIARQITKKDSLQERFAEKLSIEIKSLLAKKLLDYPEYIQVVSKIATCIENFPAGALAFKYVEIEVAEHLNKCLECCVKTLSEVKLSPTDKNEIFSLSHLALRLLLYIIQKTNENNRSILVAMFEKFRSYIEYLLFDGDAPMDTKTLCGLIFLTMELIEKGPDAWIEILKPTPKDGKIISFLQTEAGQLSLCSAIATVVPVDRIQGQVVDSRPAILCLTEKIIAIGERSSSESVFILGVTRTIVQLSKMLDKVSDKAVGSALMDEILAFVWGHLEHYMDSVRHLAAQALANVVRYCTNMHRKGDDSGLDQLFAALSALDQTRKSYYVSVTSLSAQLGAARVHRRLPTVVCDVTRALGSQAVQASATTTLEMLLQKHSQESNAGTIYDAWIVPILAHVGSQPLDSAVLSILENLMAKAVTLNEDLMNYILPHIKESYATPNKPDELKCILMLVSVARKSGVASKLTSDSPGDWKGMISYEVLRRAAVDAVEETRILSLSLIAESPKSTEVYSEGDLDLVLYFLRYNINAQSPNFRQLTVALMKKFIKRLEDSYKVLRRQSSGAHYPAFMGRLRAQCFASLLPGANYSRRVVALQLLAWTEDLQLEGYTKVWKEEYVVTLLGLLEDSYENNKALALQVLDGCPKNLLQNKKYRVSLDLEDILREASSMKPTDCVSAAYKLDFLRRKLPEHILKGNACNMPEPVLYTLLKRLLSEIQQQLAVCRSSVVLAARRAPVYGALHCAGLVVQVVPASAISEDPSWRNLIAAMIATCMEVTASVACVVNNDSPEGHLPMDAGGVAANDFGNSGDVRLEDGRPVTAQMVLLCAWRSVKEVSLLLGTIASRLTIAGEGQETGTLSHQQMVLIGEHFTKLLAETKHRGAFEQAYVGFTRLLTRLWRCRSGPLHALPRRWLRALTLAVRAPHPARSATRRSAGLPFMIQALVTTELQVQGNPKCLRECMTSLLRLARTTSAESIQNNIETDKLDIANDNYDKIDTKNIDITENGTDNRECDSNKSRLETSETQENHIESLSQDNIVETRTHSLNILRALFRNSALEESVAGFVGEGLMVALTGFEGDTWMERNSSTLLFSALMVRVFGVARARTADVPALRNTMTGRVFFLRYPQLYDFMLNKLKEAVATIDTQLHPSLFPILVLLGRLYPSSLEGTLHSLRLAGLAPRVRACAAARALPVRQLAARALPPIVQLRQYIPHLESLFATLHPGISHNYTHGILLQITRLLERARGLDIGGVGGLAGGVREAVWVLQQAAGQRPCYVIAEEYVKMVNIVIWRYPSMSSDETLAEIKGYLEKILFTKNIPSITLGREICLANCMYLYFVILNKIPNTNNLCELIYKGLEHKTYEVVLSTLNYLLILHKKLEIDSCRFQQHLATMDNENVLNKLRDTPEYVANLCKTLHSNKYPECVQKTLRVLTLEKNTQKYVVGLKIEDKTEITDDEIVQNLFDCIKNEHENLTHIYLESLSNFVTEKLKDCGIAMKTILDVLRVVFACSSSDNSDSTRMVVAGFMERSFGTLLEHDLGSLTEEEKFEFRATVLATTVTILEDDDETIRQRTSDVIAMTSQSSVGVIPARAAEVLRGMVRERGDSGAIFVLLALLDFKSEVCMTDEISDECRVFDQNERYNIFLEECVWSSACADEILQLCERTEQSAEEFVRNALDNNVYKTAFDKLCNNNIIIFKKMINDKTVLENLILNPKIKVFIRKLSL